MFRSSAAQFVLALLVAIAVPMCPCALHDALGAAGLTDDHHTSCRKHTAEHPCIPYKDHDPCCDDSDHKVRRVILEFSPGPMPAPGVPARCAVETPVSIGCAGGEGGVGTLPGCFDVPGQFTLLRLHCALMV